MSVPTFFFVSALLFYRNSDNKLYLEVVKGKLRTLIIPYLCWNIICFPLKELKNVMASGSISSLSITDVLYKIVMSQYDPVLWFIRILFIYFLFYPVILWVVKKKKLLLFVIVGAFMLNVYIGPVTGYSTARYWLPIYLLGAYLGYWKKEEIFRMHTICNWKGIAVALVGAIILWTAAFYNDYGMYVCRMFSPICYWIIADMFLIDENPRWFMKQSFYYYSSQMIFSIVAQKVYIAIAGKGVYSAILSNVFIPALLMIVLCITAYIFNRLLPRTYNFLTGGRS